MNIRKIAAILCVSAISLTATAAPEHYQSCKKCHDSGALGAPKTHDSAAWAPLIDKKGVNGLVQSTKKGTSQMPAMGLCASCTDAQLAALIEYMAK